MFITWTIRIYFFEHASSAQHFALLEEAGLLAQVPSKDDEREDEA